MCGCQKDEVKEEIEPSNLKNITYAELMDKINNKESFILEFVQTGCTNCAAFTPKFKSVLEEYNIIAYSLNISTSVNAKEIDKLLDEYGIDGTPAVLFFKDGHETSTMKRIVGNQNKDVIKLKLESAGYIS